MIEPVSVPILLDVDLSIEDLELDTDLSTEDYGLDLETAIHVIHTDGEKFDGPYVVIPEFESQNLETKNKLLQDDVLVEAIAVSRVSNLSGGTTVYIGGIFNG